MGLFTDWRKTRVGTGYRIDLDNQSYDCVDVPKDYAQFLYKKSWQEVYCWGNAKDHWANIAPRIGKYWTRQSSPQIGDIVCMSGAIGGGYGHVAVVIDIDGNDIIVAQQNTFTQSAIYTGRFSKSASYIQGYLRPVIAIGDPKPELQPYQRIVAPAEGVVYRKAPNTGGERIEVFSKGEIVNFKGWVRGQAVDGNDVWFVGRFTGGYSWSGGYTNTSTSGLEDLNPKPNPMTPTQRQVGNDVMNVRSEPKLMPDNVVASYNPAHIVDMKGYVKGQDVDGVDIWFVDKSGRYIWSGGFTNRTTSGLADLTPKPPTNPTPDPTPTPEPEPEPSNALPLATIVNKKHPIVPQTFEPNRMVVVGGRYMEETAGKSLAQMVKDSGNLLVPQSGYRSFETQQTVYAGWVARDGQAKADTYSARAGYSEHQTGYTIDFAPIDESFRDSKAYQWLRLNATKYGWIERYPDGKQDVTGYTPEPWHWRYVGVEIAQAMAKAGSLTMEEHFSVEGGLYPDQEKPTPEPTPTPDPTTPKPPKDEPTPTPETPAPPSEATKSATKFVARIATQLASAKLIVTGLVGLLAEYDLGLTITPVVENWLTIIVALGIIFMAQYGYKIKARFKWLF